MSDNTSIPPVPTPASGSDGFAPTADAGPVLEPDTVVVPVTPAAADVPAEETPATDVSRRARKGALVAGAVALPLVTTGILGLAVPLGVWYLSTLIRTVVVVIANAANGDKAAQDANQTLSAVDPASLSTFTLVFAIVGAAFLIAGVLVSVFVLRSHGVARVGTVTGFGIAVGLVISTTLAASIGALTGLIFATSETVGDVLATAALGLALTVIGAVVVSVLAGALVWLWMARLFRVVPEPASR